MKFQEFVTEFGMRLAAAMPELKTTAFAAVGQTPDRRFTLMSESESIGDNLDALAVMLNVGSNGDPSKCKVALLIPFHPQCAWLIITYFGGSQTGGLGYARLFPGDVISVSQPIYPRLPAIEEEHDRVVALNPLRRIPGCGDDTAEALSQLGTANVEFLSVDE